MKGDLAVILNGFYRRLPRLEFLSWRSGER